VIAFSSSNPSPNWDVSGTWTGSSGLVGNLIYDFTMTITQDDLGNVTGTIVYPNHSITRSVSGHVEGDVFVFITEDSSYWATCDACEITWTPSGSFSFSGEGRDPNGNPYRFVGWQASGLASVLPADGNDCQPGDYPGYNFVESLFVSAVGSGDNTPVVNSSVLEANVPYRIEASGTYFAGGSGKYDIRADAEYSEDAYQRTNDLPWTDLVRGYEGYGEGLLELKIDDSFVEWGDYSDSHIYTQDILGGGAPLTFSFQIWDIYAQNNTGGLCVSLFKFVNRPPVAEINGPYSGVEGSFVIFDNTGTYDPDGDELTYETSFGDGIVLIGPPGLSHIYADGPGLSPYNLCLTAIDPHGAESTDCTDVNIANAPPEVNITFPLDGDLYQVGTSINIASDFTDPGVLDTHTCSINWGPASTTGTVIESDGSGTCTGFYSYLNAGVYNVEVSVTDNDGDTGSDTVMVVVYDPSGGFVTGGGWFTSPEGAYKPDPNLAGKATFGFVSKYKKGATVPEGNTEFQFKAGDLNFHSTSYDWLVVTGSDYAKFKGMGTINGEGEYKFQIWAGDGTGDDGADTFRISIWYEIVHEDGVTEEVVVYNSGDQEIGGGNIVVHTSKK
jgi:hypothetical protein